MKRKIAAVCAAALLGAAVFAGCGAEPADSAPESAAAQSSAQASLVGEWELVKSTVNGVELDVRENKNVYIFGGDGAFELQLNGETMGVGTYVVDGDTVTFDLDGAKTEMTLDGVTLTTKSETPDGPAVQVHQRVDAIAKG